MNPHPTKHILSPTFKYVNAANTDIRKTFERVMAQQPVKNTVRELKKVAK